MIALQLLDSQRLHDLDEILEIFFTFSSLGAQSNKDNKTLQVQT